MAFKYFFLSDGWSVGRVWSTEGLWNEFAWRRSPQIARTNVSIIERGEALWLYRTEEAVLMVEVKQDSQAPELGAIDSESNLLAPAEAKTDSMSESKPFGQVVLKNLLDADRVLERLSNANAACQLDSSGKF